MNNLKVNFQTNPDSKELIHFLQGIERIRKKESYVKLILSIANHHILAYYNGKLIGWVALLEVNPATMFLFEWHPLVCFHSKENKIKEKLLNEAFKLTASVNIPNLRTFIDIVNPSNSKFNELENLFFRAGMIKTHIQDCMELQLSKTNLKNIEIPQDVIIGNLTTENKKELLQIYEIVFENSLDDFINSLDDFERRYWDLFGDEQIPEIAAVLKKHEKVIGFIGVRDEVDYVEIGPVGILPEFRGNKFGSVLLNYVLTKLLEKGKTEVYLEVGSRNKVAYNLYYSYGFRKVSEKHGFLKKMK